MLALVQALRFKARSGVARSLFDVAVRTAEQEYHAAHGRLQRLEASGLVTVERHGPPAPLLIRFKETRMTNLFVAIDPGFGNTKVCVNAHVSCQQSAVARPVKVGLAASGMKVADDAVRWVKFDSYEFVAGGGAWRWGHTIGSMDYAGLVGPERLALMYAGIADVCAPGDLGDVYLVCGLPVPLMQDTAQMGPVTDGLRKLKREHRFTVNGRDYRLVIAGIKGIAQPVGAYMDWLYNDEELKVREGAGRAEVAVVDLGMNTLDLFVVERGQVRPGFLGGDKVGVRRLLNLLSNNGYELTELDSMLREGRLRAREGELEIWLGEVLATMERVWPSLRRFTAVIPTGGGAAILGDRLTAALGAKGAAVYWPDDPLVANVKGLWKFGIKHVAQK